VTQIKDNFIHSSNQCRPTMHC